MSLNRLPSKVDDPQYLQESGLDLVHRVLEPVTGADSALGPRPTIVMLHGMGGDERVMWIFASKLPTDWLIVAPRAIHPAPGMDGYAWQPRGHDEWPDIQAFRPAADAVASFVGALPAAYGADPHRTYLLGFSQGAATAFALAMLRPGTVAGIGSLVGFAPEAPKPLVDTHPLADLPVFMAAGTADPLVHIAVARA